MWGHVARSRFRPWRPERSAPPRWLSSTRTRCGPSLMRPRASPTTEPRFPHRPAPTERRRRQRNHRRRRVRDRVMASSSKSLSALRVRDPPRQLLALHRETLGAGGFEHWLDGSRRGHDLRSHNSRGRRLLAGTVAWGLGAVAWGGGVGTVTSAGLAAAAAFGATAAATSTRATTGATLLGAAVLFGAASGATSRGGAAFEDVSSASRVSAGGKSGGVGGRARLQQSRRRWERYRHREHLPGPFAGEWPRITSGCLSHDRGRAVVTLLVSRRRHRVCAMDLSLRFAFVLGTCRVVGRRHSSFPSTAGHSPRSPRLHHTKGGDSINPNGAERDHMPPRLRSRALAWAEVASQTNQRAEAYPLRYGWPRASVTRHLRRVRLHCGGVKSRDSEGLIDFVTG